MADIEELKQSETIRIVGGEEDFAADVILKPDGSKRLRVDSETSISTDLAIIQQIDVDQSLSNATYYTIFSDTGIKTISGFALEFSNRNVFVKLTLDGVTIFDLDVSKLRDILDWNQASLPNFYVSWNDNLKAFYFTPAFPIKSTTDVSIEARGKSGSRVYVGGLIQVG
jgi:hypothetical protein